MTTLAAGPSVRLPTVPDDPRILRSAFSRIPQSVAAVCSLKGSGEPVGFIVSTLTVVSLSPPLVSICVQAGSRTWETLRTAPRIGVSILAETQSDVSRSLAAGGAHRFENVKHRVAESGALLISEAVMWMECARAAEIRAGDHHVVVLSIEALNVPTEREPLVFQSSRYRRLHAD
jgi:flavin reductase (DIM6/NTAB) family NADH-FMN oxidoreductase RutF